MENLEREEIVIKAGIYKIIAKDRKGEHIDFYVYCKDLKKALKRCLGDVYDLVVVSCFNYGGVLDISKHNDEFKTLFKVKYVPTNTEIEEWILADNYQQVLKHLKGIRNITLIDNYIQGVEIILQ